MMEVKVQSRDKLFQVDALLRTTIIKDPLYIRAEVFESLLNWFKTVAYETSNHGPLLLKGFPFTFK